MCGVIPEVDIVIACIGMIEDDIAAEDSEARDLR